MTRLDLTITIIIIVSSFISFILVSCYNNSQELAFLFLLPLVFILCSLILCFERKIFYHSITGLVVLFVYYVRLVLAPMIMVFGNYHSVIPLSQYSSFVNPAIVLICLESLFVFFALPRLGRKNEKNDFKKNILHLHYHDFVLIKKKHNYLLWGVVVLMIGYVVWLIKSDSTIWDANFLLLIDSNKGYYALSSSKSGIGTLSMFVEIMNSMFKILQVLLPAMLLCLLVSVKLPNVLKLFLSFGIFVIVSVIATEDRIDAIFAGIAFLLTARDAFGTKFKNHFVAWLFGLLLVCIAGLSIKAGVFGINKNGSTSLLESVSSMLCAYFSGVPTVAYGLSFVSEIGFMKLWYIPIDIIERIPFASYALKLFFNINLISSNALFNEYIFGTLNENYGQILPTTIVGIEYFSMLLSPIVPYVLIKMSFHFERKGLLAQDLTRKNLYYWICVCVSSSLVIASSLLVVAKMSWFVIILLILKIFGRNDFTLNKSFYKRGVVTYER